tara:strand:- start:159 stop:2003 length:1845 start_codon:yes stop_codon:yes gene_type:complete
MPLVPIENLGQIGIIKDTPPYNLPPNAWSDGNNVRLLDNGVKKVAGYQEVMATCPFAPYYIHPYLTVAGTYYWIAYGATDIAVWNGSTWTDVVRQTTLQLNGAVTAGDSSITVDTGAALTALPTSGTLEIGTDITSDASTNKFESLSYTARDTGTGVITLSGTAANNHPDDAVVTPSGSTGTTDNDYGANTTSKRWMATNLNGLVVATNGHDTPQMWPLSNGVPSLGNPFMELRNWPTGAKCKSIRSFRTFLVGLNWERTNEEPRLVKWSTEASYGSPPSTWDETDATLDAGEYELSDTPGNIIDGLPLGDSFIIYKDDSIYIMNYVGTPYIFSFKLLSPTIGLLSKEAVAEFEGGHFFMGNSDFYVCNGQTVTPMLSNRLRRTVFDELNGDNYEKCFVAADYVRNEMMACYPAGSSAVVNKALIWNWKDNTFSFRDLPDTSHINSGIVEITTGATWDAATLTWNADSDPWGATNYDNVIKNIVFADVTNTKIFRDNKGNKKDTATMSAYIERSGYDLGDPQSVKFVSAVYPQLEVSGNNTVNVYIGRQMSTEEGITWEGPTVFNPNSQSKVSCRVSGKYFGIKVESDSDIDWKLHGLAFEVQKKGLRGSRSYG